MYLLLVAETESGVRLGCDKLAEMRSRNSRRKQNKAAEIGSSGQIELLVAEVVKALANELANDGSVDGHMQD